MNQSVAQHEGRDRVDELELDDLNRGNFAQDQAPAVAGAQIDLLQIRIKRARGEKLFFRLRVVEGVGDLRQPRRCAQPDSRNAGRCDTFTAHTGRCECGRMISGAAREPSHANMIFREQGFYFLRETFRGSRLVLHEVLIERGRPAHGLRRVVDENVQARVCFDDESREEFH
jgi:hypothetical protein